MQRADIAILLEVVVLMMTDDVICVDAGAEMVTFMGIGCFPGASRSII
jgi:hypothetical protein